MKKEHFIQPACAAIKCSSFSAFLMVADNNNNYTHTHLRFLYKTLTTHTHARGKRDCSTRCVQMQEFARASAACLAENVNAGRQRRRQRQRNERKVAANNGVAQFARRKTSCHATWPFRPIFLMISNLRHPGHSLAATQQRLKGSFV